MSPCTVFASADTAARQIVASELPACELHASELHVDVPSGQ